MYDELVNNLRHCVDAPAKRGCAANCKYGKEHPLNYLCISAMMQEAADVIEELATNYDTATDIMKHQTEYIEELEAKLPCWIPVTEPPKEEEGGTFITAYSKGGVSQNWYITFHNGGGKWYQNSEDTGEVTHWMPFPESPKEES